MAKSRRISIRISEGVFSKIERMKRGKTITQFFNELIANAIEKERQEANSFIELLRKIDDSDMSKISEKLDMVLAILEQLKQPNERVEKFLKRILGESIRANIAIEELARQRIGRSDFFQQFLDNIDMRFEAIRQKGGQ